MKVIANLQPLLTPLTGIGHYTRELTLALLSLESEDIEIEGITGRKREKLDLIHPLLLTETKNLSKNIDKRNKNWELARNYLKNPVTRKIYRWLCSQRLKSGMQDPDTIYWEPNYILLPWSGRSVVTVHDLSHERYPSLHPKERVDFFNQHLSESLRRATRINVVSQFTANELKTLHDIDSNRIDIVPPAVASRFFVIQDPRQQQKIQHRYNLPKQFLLSVGTLEPRKNLVNVLEAFSSLSVQEQKQTPLLLVGMQGWGEQVYSDQVHRSFRLGTIQRLGYVHSSDLPGLYSMALGFVYVSLYEGFGMPVIEAMAAGTPVLTANTTATSEVSDGAALEVTPEDIDAIREGLRQLVGCSHNERIEKGIKRAQSFTWEASAQRLLSSFDRALNSV